MIHEMAYKSLQQKVQGHAMEDKKNKFKHQLMKKTFPMSQICEEVAIVQAKKEKLISAFQMKRRRSKEWQRLRISLAFEHRFVIIGRI
jgi:hypothetical protein